MRKLRKRPVVELTSLLDLLFVMIFVSLLQTKAPQAKNETKPDPKPVETAVAQSEPKAEPIEVVKEPAPKPEPIIVPITAVFHFYATARSPGTPDGAYSMRGEYNRENGSLSLGGTSWIKRPAGYGMVPLKGVIGAGESFTGQIEDPGCAQFTLKRTERIGNSDIAGKWEGSYFCAQGETGLSLTIQKN